MSGLTIAGFIPKRLEDIKAEYEEAYRAAFGPGINLDPRSPLGQEIAIKAERDAEIWELGEAIYNSGFPDTAEGVALTRVASLIGQSRKAAAKSVVTARAYGDETTVVPVPFILSVDGFPASRFESLTEAIVGPGTDGIQTVTFAPEPSQGSFKLVYDGEATAAIAAGDNAATVQAALEAIPAIGAGNVSVAGSFAAGFVITFIDGMGASFVEVLEYSDNTLEDAGNNPTTVAIAETEKGQEPYAEIEMSAEEAGPVQAAANTLTVIETPVSGITSATNLIAAEVGRSSETDEELRLRMVQELQRSGTATVEGIRNALSQVLNVLQSYVFENTSLITDGEGRPGKSFEAVVLGGADQDIADAIWAAKPAGIQAYGDTVVSVVDSQGFTHDIGFSRPDEVPIYLIVNITKNEDPDEGEVYPDDGDDRVKAALVEWGNRLNIGQDVVNNLMFTPVNTVPGVFGLEILAGIAPAPATSNNVEIGQTEIATFDIANVEVNS